jgi:hypothetical protein
VQARYLVRAAVQDLASGADKHFWFVGPPAHDDEVNFGVLSSGFQPWPAYSAHAAMASVLGEANVLHRLRGLPAGTVGHVFGNGDKTVTVLWAAKPTTVNVPVQGARVDVYDIMGGRKQAIPSGNTVRVMASADPVYVVTKRPAAVGPAPSAEQTAKPSTAEHIVLNQRYATANMPPGKDNGDAPPPHGYRLDATTRMLVDVYNFTDRPQTVVLSGRASGGWSVRPATRTTVRVSAKGRVSVPFVLDSGGKVAPGLDHRLVFEATLGGDRVPRSVAWIQLKR